MGGSFQIGVTADPLYIRCKLSYHSRVTALEELRQLGDAWQNRPELIEQARQERATWAAIAEALHMTRQGVVKLHATLKENQS